MPANLGLLDFIDEEIGVELHQVVFRRHMQIGASRADYIGCALDLGEAIGCETETYYSFPITSRWVP